MTDARPDNASLVERIRPVAAGAAVVAVHFLGDDAVFVLGEEALLFWRDGEEHRAAVHGGAILASACDGERVVTGGGDGQGGGAGKKSARRTPRHPPRGR